MSEVTVALDIDAPPQAVFDLANDPARLGEWVTIVRSVDSHDDGRLRLGWKMTETLVLRGVPFQVDWECVELDEPWLSVLEGKGPVRSRARVVNRLSETPDGGTHYEYTNDFRAPFGPLGKTAARVVAGGVPEREALGSLQNLKAILERERARA